MRKLKSTEYSADGTVLIRETDDASRGALIVKVQRTPVTYSRRWSSVWRSSLAQER
ncbi:MAG: hypothetical protein AAGF11_34695 [Myxococcota bacterium]